MRFLYALPIAAMALGLSGCALRKTPAAKAVPVAPKPVVVPAPAPPPQPLSIPQTNVQLPPPQPLTPEAIATTQLPGEPAPSPPTPPRTAPATRTPRPPVQRNTEAATPPAPAPATPPAAEPEPPRAIFTEVLSQADQKRFQDEAAARGQEARRIVDQLSRTRRRQQENAVQRVEGFLKQAQEAERRGDMRQAAELAGRALVLAKELKP